MSCSCGAGCAAGACAASAGAFAAIAACGAIANSDYEPEPFDIVCRHCNHDLDDHDKKGCNVTRGIFHKTQCTCSHFAFDKEKIEKAKTEIINILFKNVPRAEKLEAMDN